MRIVHFDIGANMALAHNGFGDFIVTEHKLFAGPRAHRAGETTIWLRRRLSEIKAECGLEAVCYERPFARGRDATRCLWGLAGIIEAEATNAGFPVVDAENAQIKKFARSLLTNTKGMEPKEVLLAAAHLLGYIGDIEHEADAYVGLKYAERFVFKVSPSKGKK